MSLYIFLSQGVICDLFLMPAMMAISQKYGMSKTVAGVFIAIGVTMPDVVVTMISFQRHGTKMTEFGLACNLGGAAFSFTMIPAVAYLLNFGCRKKRPDQPISLRF